MTLVGLGLTSRGLRIRRDGNTRSVPTPWTVERRAAVCRRHRRAPGCQPGHPGPHGVGQDSSPGRDLFRSVKASGSRFGRFGSVFSVSIIWSGR